MKRSYTVIACITAALMPLVPFVYLFNRNSEYLDAGQALLVTGALIVLGCLGFGVLKLLFKANVAALAGCAIVWTAFYAFASAYDFARARGFTAYRILIVYVSLAMVLTLFAGFLLRKARRDGWIPAAALFLCAMILMNGVPAGIRALQSMRAASAFDKSGLKLDFTMDEATPSPNVYWIHCDGMLGFDAMAKYFGDDQAAFKAELTARGFIYAESAMLEAAHTTQMAVAELMCPQYCDTALEAVTHDHETAMRVKADEAYLKGELTMARFYNETVRAFQQKGYHTDTIAGFGIWFTPLVERFYNIGGANSGYPLDISGSDEEIIAWCQDMISWNEMAQLLIGKLGGVVVRAQIGKKARTQEIDPARISEILINPEGKSQYENLLRALYDSFTETDPTLRVISYEMCHAPFNYMENGALNDGDSGDIHSYGAHHAYSTKVLVRLLDMILEQDPDAVIVLQADHGLHGQSKEQITAAFGEDAAIDIWNNVMSAIRVSEKYKTVDLEKTMDTPLNMARYLVNSYVGENYAYIEEG